MLGKCFSTLAQTKIRECVQTAHIKAVLALLAIVLAEVREELQYHGDVLELWNRNKHGAV